MAEVKRPKLYSVGCERVNDKNKKEIRKTVRISVVLTDSTEDSFPEFNYQDELSAVKKKSQPNGLDPFTEDDDDVKRIAAQMEAKYGMSITKKRKYKKDDFADIGMGYDESDSFIDNTDGYDEIIPKNVTAVHGGFYINCGALEFKADEAASSDESSSSEDEAQKKLAGRKRILDSSAASEEETPDTEKPEIPEKKQKLIGLNGMQKAIKKRLFSHEKIKQIRKRRNSETKRTVRELLRERRVEMDLTITDFDKSTMEQVEIDTTVASNENKKSDSVDHVIESVISAASKKKEEKSEDLSIEIPKNDVIKEAVNNSLEQDLPTIKSSEDPVNPIEYVQLPENLPTDIKQIIENLKNAAASSNEGKVKFFTGNVNVLLLNLEKKCRCLGKGSRNKVYEHLAPYVKCRKETIIKRAKNLLIIEEKKKIKALLEKLTSAINISMPELLRQYEEERQLIVKKKFSLDDESKKNLRMPKRHFSWNEDTKKLLRDIIALRKKCFINEGKNKESLEQSLITFLKSEVQVIWPEGWISMSTLMKYSNLPKDRKALVEASKKSNNALPLEVIDNSHISSTPNISVNSNSGITITPVCTNISKNSPVEVRSTSVTPSETLITRLSSDSNSSKTSIVYPLTPPDISKTSQVDHGNLIPTTNSPAIVASQNEKSKHNLVEEESLHKDEDLLPKPAVKYDSDESLKAGENLTVEKIKQEITITNAPKSDTLIVENNVIDLTDQPELRRKPGPKSKLKYYPPEHKYKKESSNINDKFNGTAIMNKVISDSLGSDLSRVTHRTNHHTSPTNSHNSSVLKNHKYDYPVVNSLVNDYKKINLSATDLSKTKTSVADLMKTKTSVTDLSKNKLLLTDAAKQKSSITDLSKMKLPAAELSIIKNTGYDLTHTKSSSSELSKMKSPSNDMSRTSPHINDYSKIRIGDYRNVSASEGDDIQKAMEGLMALQKLASPVKPKDDTRTSSAVSVINYNSSYSQDSRHSSSSSQSPVINCNSTSSNAVRRSNSFQDAFQKQFIPDLNSMRMNQLKPSYNSLPKYNHNSYKSSSSIPNDRYFQNSNYLYSQQSSNKFSNCSSSQSVDSYMLDDMYTNFLNEYGRPKAANSKSSTHQK